MKKVAMKTPKKETQQRYPAKVRCDRAGLQRKGRWSYEMLCYGKGTIDSEIMERKSIITRLNKQDYISLVMTVMNKYIKVTMGRKLRFDSLGRFEDIDGILKRRK
ncbi:hypothetical protein Tco_1320411 [Tanacetum coccineum]